MVGGVLKCDGETSGLLLLLALEADECKCA
jgi:hypothetical protein